MCLFIQNGMKSCYHSTLELLLANVYFGHDLISVENTFLIGLFLIILDKRPTNKPRFSAYIYHVNP